MVALGPPTPQSARLADHPNAFGSLRLLFASCVVISHTPEIISGSRSQELLTAAFGTISLGDLAVDFFFLVSGYLIALSYVTSPSATNYPRKRVARIYPGFLCAYLSCIVVVAPIGGAAMPKHFGEFGSVILRALLLQPPNLGAVFSGTPFPFLNTSMWTISIEFRCYLLVLLIGWIGLQERRFIVELISVFILAVVMTLPL